MGNALIDTGSQVSLVKETGFARGLKTKRQVVQIHGIAGNVMEAKGKVDLCIGETSPHEFWTKVKYQLPCKLLRLQNLLTSMAYLGCLYFYFKL
jgi:hypothetical protein